MQYNYRFMTVLKYTYKFSLCHCLLILLKSKKFIKKH